MQEMKLARTRLRKREILKMLSNKGVHTLMMKDRQQSHQKQVINKIRV